MLARFGLGKTALTVSVLAHAGFAVVAVRHAQRAAPAYTADIAEVPAPDLLPLEPEAEPPSPEHEEAPRAPERNTAVAALARTATATPSKSVLPSEAEADPAPPPSVLAAPEPSAPRFTMLVAATSAPVSGVTTSAGHAATEGSAGSAPIAESAAEVPAKLRSGAPPAYTAEALAAGVESDVPLEIIVDIAGSVRSVRVLTHVGYGLDEAALASVRGYRFAPAQRGGAAVAVRMRWVMRFQLR
jgi:protein TonB